MTEVTYEFGGEVSLELIEKLEKMGFSAYLVKRTLNRNGEEIMRKLIDFTPDAITSIRLEDRIRCIYNGPKDPDKLFDPLISTSPLKYWHTLCVK